MVASLAGIQSSVQYHSAADPQVALLQLALAGQAPVGYLKVLQQQEAEVLEVGQDKLAAAQEPDDDVIDEDPLVGAAVLQELLLAVVGSDSLPSALQYVATQAQIGEWCYMVMGLKLRPRLLYLVPSWCSVGTKMMPVVARMP